MATLVFLHAHPDDEALLTAGTMARAAAEGQRVVLVVATDGGAGLAASGYTDLAATRARELDASAQVLGVDRVVRLGYADSGLHGDQPGPTLVRATLGAAADRLAAILAEERADVLVTYDPAGGYGHPDHVRCHQIAVAAAGQVGTARVFEATAPREVLARAVRLVGLVYRYPPEFDPRSFERAFTPAAQITHRVDVRPFLARKRAAMAAHASQASADGADRTLAAFLRLPSPAYAAVFGTEYFRRREGVGSQGAAPGDAAEP